MHGPTFNPPLTAGTDAFTAMMASHLSAGQADAARRMFHSLRDGGRLVSEPHKIVLFNVAIDAEIQCGDLTAAWQIFDDVMANGRSWPAPVTLDGITFELMFETLGREAHSSDYAALLLRGMDEVDLFSKRAGYSRHERQVDYHETQVFRSLDSVRDGARNPTVGPATAWAIFQSLRHEAHRFPALEGHRIEPTTVHVVGQGIQTGDVILDCMHREGWIAEPERLNPGRIRVTKVWDEATDAAQRRLFAQRRAERAASRSQP